MPVPDVELVGLIVGVALALSVVDAVPESEPVVEALAPRVSDPVGVCDNDRDRLNVELGVTEGVAVPDGLEVAVAVTLEEAALDELGVPELLDVTDALAPNETDDVGVPEYELLREIVDVGVNGSVPVGDVVAETGDGDLLAEAPCDSVMVGVPDTDEDKHCDDERLSLIDGVGDEVDAPPEPVPYIIDEGLEVGVVLEEIVEEPVSDKEPVHEGLAPFVSDAVGVGERDAEGVGEEESVGGMADEEIDIDDKSSAGVIVDDKVMPGLTSAPAFDALSTDVIDVVGE